VSEMLTMSRGLLEDYKRQARAEEQERIINLLEDDSAGYCSCKWGINELDSGDLVEVQEFTCEPHRYIALIKGENKQEYPQALPLPPKTPKNTQPNWTGF
jgi:hypothetical protein